MRRCQSVAIGIGQVDIGREIDRECAVRLLEEAAIDRSLLDRILEKHGLTAKLNKLGWETS